MNERPASPENSISIDEQKIEADFTSNNNLFTGLKIDVSLELNENPGAAYGTYSIARTYGELPSKGIQLVVGVHATAVKQSRHAWVAALHADVYDTAPGGTSIGLNIEFPKTAYGTATYGINMQPMDPKAKDLIGMQIQCPEFFKYSMVVPNMSHVFGQVDTCLFGMRFNPQRQSLEFFRAIGQPDELKVGEIKMDFGQVRPANKW